MSTSEDQSGDASSLKQEARRRIAAHQSREGTPITKPAAPSRNLQGRAAEAAARVAAHFAQAPSYSQMQAAEAQTGQSSAQNALPGSQKAAAAPRQPEPPSTPSAASVEPLPPAEQAPAPAGTPVQPAAPIPLDASQDAAYRLVGEPDFPSDSAGSMVTPAEFALDPTEPAPARANLIEFPRELVAPLKKRPRRAEGPLAAEDELEGEQSLIEEVSGALPALPEAADAAPSWPGPEWSGIELEAQPADEPEPEDEPVPQWELHLASFGRRMAAVLADCTLIACAFLGAVLAAAANIHHPFPAKIVILGAAATLLLTGLLYHALFLTLAGATPGMKCARISLCTFDGQRPTRAQLRGRLGALLLSVLPLGLGVAWALFDDGHLCWHDRLSKTYLRAN